jgi:uncharacterized protein YqgV (UPF0045/DUF77 family)
MKPVPVVSEAEGDDDLINKILWHLKMFGLKEPITVVKDVMDGRWAEVNELLKVDRNYTIAAVEFLCAQCRIQDVLEIIRITFKSYLQLFGSQPNCLLPM